MRNECAADQGEVPYRRLPDARGLTPDGRIFDFAKNLLNATEFAGACFSPDGSTLFLNIMGSNWDAGSEQGVTVAIRGPWTDGAL